MSKKIIFLVLVFLLLTASNIIADDVSIDSSGNVKTGMSNADAVSGLKIKPTVSIGIAQSTIKGLKSHQDIYKAADDALYQEKKKKKIKSRP